MKRFTAIIAATATALTMSTAAATARTSSDVSDLEAGIYVGRALTKGEDGFTSSVNKAGDYASSKAEEANSSDVREFLDDQGEDDNASSTSSKGFLWDTVKSDTANEWKIGTTLEIIVGVGIAAIAAAAGVAAVAAGLVPGVELPF